MMYICINIDTNGISIFQSEIQIFSCRGNEC